MPDVNRRWLDSRLELHRAFDRICEPPDASWLAYLGRYVQDYTTQQVAERWAAADRDPGLVPAVNHVYLHVPFCKSICSFCNYERLQPRRPELLRIYEARVIEALEALAPSLRGIPWHTLYLGGGTPSVLPADQLRRIVNAFDANLDFTAQSTRYFEMDPAVMSAARLDTLLDLGFHHFSFGIQSLDPLINDAHNRGSQGREVISQRFAEFRERGVHDVSCDFLLGLAGTTVDGIIAEVREVLANWRPTWIDTYQVTPTRAYLDSHFGGSRAAFDAHMRPFLDRGPEELRKLAEEFEYVFVGGDGHHISMYDHREPPLQADGSRPNIFGEYTAYSQLASEQDAPLHLLGLGTSARSRIFGGGFYEYRDPGDDVGNPGPAHWEGHDIDIRDDALCYLVHDLRDTDIVDRQRFSAVFGRHLVEIFPDAVAAWRALGILVEATEDRLVLKSQTRRERVRTLLWLIPEDRMEWEIARRVGLSLAPDDLAARLAPIGPGTVFGGWRVDGWGPARIRLRHRHGLVDLRVRPDLAGGDVPGMVVEGRPPPGSVDELRSVVRIIRRAFAATTRARQEAT